MARCRARAKKMLAAIRAINPRQADLIVDPAPHSSGLCPRRAGKSYAGAATALITGEAKPGAISIIISLNRKQLQRLYWNFSPSGLQRLSVDFGLNLQFQNTMLRWEHENGSIGYLMGIDDDEQLELLRGMEADLYLLDECKSIPATRLEKLLTEVIAPQRATRQGRVVLIGTPGHAKAGPFYLATCPSARDASGNPTSITYTGKGKKPGKSGPRLWSRHHWTLEDNSAVPHQWEEALRTKAECGWSDTHPIWRREYLGEWTDGDGDDLVYSYAAAKEAGKGTWTPECSDENKLGLPESGAPWRFVAGMDLGFMDKTSLVVAAYSTKLRQLRHVWDFSAGHMIVDDVADLLAQAFDRFGNIERIFVDAGNLGKMVVETLARHGFPLESADKREKNDYIELLNSAFMRGEVMVIPALVAQTQGWESNLEPQLLSDVWKLDKGSRAELARAGRLFEDPTVPNDCVDAFLYLYRGSLHQFGNAIELAGPPEGSPEWEIKRRREELAKMRARLMTKPDDRLGSNKFTTAPQSVQRALLRRERWNESARPTFKRPFGSSSPQG